MSQTKCPTVANSDCLDWLPTIADGSVDLILIDPPYGISRPTGFQGCRETPKTLDKFRVSMDFGEWDKGDVFSTIEKSIEHSYRILRSGGTFICFYDIWKTSFLAAAMRDVGFVQLRMIEWIKTNPVPINSSVNYLSNAKEVAVVGVKGSNPTFHSKFDSGVYNFASESKGRIHPTQKPEHLITALIKKHSDEGNVVADFFSGSGTTAVCCVKNKRRFIGCEIDPGYCAVANERISPTIFS